MGNFNSKSNNNDSVKCLICWDQIDSIDLVQCTRCTIHMHAYCEEIYRGKKGYCKCPHCQQVGTLAVGHYD